jgi:metallo-beta-lactamase class B
MSIPRSAPARLALAVSLLAAAPAAAQQAPQADSALAAPPTPGCTSCPEWNVPQRPFRIHGNSWYVGTRGLSAVLVTSPQGHVLLDGGLPESAALIAANVRALGFRMEDVRLILNSHAHFDHAGGIAALQRVSKATVAAHPWSAAMMRRGSSLPEDPQHELDIPYPAVPTVRVLADGETVRVGPLALTAHFTGGHTPGGTSWSWRACEGDRCLDLVYADSQTPVSADGYLFTRSTRYPSVLDDFARGFATLESLRCDVLLTPHPSASTLFERLAAREQGRADAFRDPSACRRYAAGARQRLAQRVATERGAAAPGARP